MAKTETAKTARINLNVPYMARKHAKAIGAYFDNAHKVWYTYAGFHNLEALRRYMAPADQKVYLA